MLIGNNKDNIRITDINQTSNYNIYYAKLSYTDKNNNVFGKEIIIKMYLNKIPHKSHFEMMNEANILNIIANRTNGLLGDVHVPRSFSYGINNNGHNVQYIERIFGDDLVDVDWSNLAKQGFNTDNIKRKIFLRIAKAIKCLHTTYQKAHCDIKPDNIMMHIDDGIISLYLIDFAFAIPITNQNESNRFSCTVDYASPELLCGKSYDLQANDVWCLGSTILNLFIGDRQTSRQNITIQDRIDDYIDYCDNSYLNGHLPEDIYEILLLIFVKQENRIKINDLVIELEKMYGGINKDRIIGK